jgi:hypothetical protein
MMLCSFFPLGKSPSKLDLNACAVRLSAEYFFLHFKRWDIIQLINAVEVVYNRY